MTASREMDGTTATETLLRSLDELYPLPDDEKRVERAGRTAFVLKQWMQQVFKEFESRVPQFIREYALSLVGSAETAEPHTGDDALLDALAEARCSLESIADDPEVDREDAIAVALDALTRADRIRVAEVEAQG